jgi:hypothetical protein
MNGSIVKDGTHVYNSAARHKEDGTENPDQYLPAF